MCHDNVANVQAFSGRQYREHNVIMERGARQDPPRTVQREGARERSRRERERQGRREEEREKERQKDEMRER